MEGAFKREQKRGEGARQVEVKKEQNRGRRLWRRRWRQDGRLFRFAQARGDKDVERAWEIANQLHKAESDRFERRFQARKRPLGS